MQLTRFTDYALRVLISVGLNDKRGGERGVTIGEISAQYGISRNHLMKVVQQLGRQGYLETLRGKGGGLRLGIPASEIRLGDVVRETEGGFHLVPCFDAEHPEACAITPACVLRKALGTALGAFLEVLDRYTLEDLLVADRELEALLGPRARVTRRTRRPGNGEAPTRRAPRRIASR
ncbi:MAG: Rrf2 family transcriptional regulator [Gammaproteobacteria bacterium]|nr:Rrf2 family transcriptional regulator [Gammaproteobacteria bacterium]